LEDVRVAAEASGFSQLALEARWCSEKWKRIQTNAAKGPALETLQRDLRRGHGEHCRRAPQFCNEPAKAVRHASL